MTVPLTRPWGTRTGGGSVGRNRRTGNISSNSRTANTNSRISRAASSIRWDSRGAGDISRASRGSYWRRVSHRGWVSDRARGSKRVDGRVRRWGHARKVARRRRSCKRNRRSIRVSWITSACSHSPRTLARSQASGEVGLEGGVGLTDSGCELFSFRGSRSCSWEIRQPKKTSVTQ